tara:strand:- start:1176 stop:2156 length:981 start_codon:yes stop_codon:yes gene_type:complete
MNSLKTIFLFSLVVTTSSLEAEQIMKTWFGDPDLQGTWTNASLTTLERPDNFKSLVVTKEEANVAASYAAEFTEVIDNPYEEGESPKAGENVGGYNTAWMDPGTQLFKINGEYRSSILIYPDNGRLPRKWTSWGMEAPSLYRMFTQANHPEQRSLGERCLVGFGSSGGPPMLNVLYNNHYQIVQSPGYVLILVEMVHDARIIRLEGTSLPDHIRPWLGDSIGHWEGNTLVVKTKNHHLQQRFRAAIRHQILMTENAEVTERFTRISEDEILYEFSVDDDLAYKDLWSGEMPLRKAEGKIYEYACHEGNYSMANILAGAREEERRNQ